MGGAPEGHVLEAAKQTIGQRGMRGYPVWASLWCGPPMIMWMCQQVDNSSWGDCRMAKAHNGLQSCCHHI